MRAKLIKKSEIVEQEQKVEKRKATAASTVKQAPATVRTWVKQQQSVKTSAYQAFAALFTDPQTTKA